MRPWSARKRRKEREKPPLSSPVLFDLAEGGQAIMGEGQGWGWRAAGFPVAAVRLLFGLADFKHDWGIPGRQKNLGPRLGSQSKITHVFISDRQMAAARGWFAGFSEDWRYRWGLVGSGLLERWRSPAGCGLAEGD